MKNTERSRATSANQVLELQQLIAAPLLATVDADSLAAQRYLDYLFRIAFEDYDQRTATAHRLRLVTFEYEAVDGGLRRRQRVSIPMLTLVPLPLLQVRDAAFDFDIDILDCVSEQAATHFSLSEGRAVADAGDEQPLRLRATLAPQGAVTARRSSTNLAANMKIRVRMSRSDMPGGLSKLLHLAGNDALQSRAEPVPAADELTENKIKSLSTDE